MVLADSVPVVAVAMAPVVPLELISPLPEVREMALAVNVAVPKMVPVPLADKVMEPEPAELVETALVPNEIPAPLTFVCRVIVPPFVVVPNVIAPPTVSVLPAVTVTDGVVVDEMIPVLTVVTATISRLSLPKVMVLPVLVNELPPYSQRVVTLVGAVKLVPVA